MTLFDVALVSGLAVFAAAWWIRATPHRSAVLLASAAVSSGAGLAGVLDYRWQAWLGLGVAGVYLLVLLVNRLRKAPARKGVPFVSGPLLTLPALAAVGMIWLFPVDPLPGPAGASPVGVRTFDLVDATRPGILGASPGEPRRLLVRVWYPAGDTAGLKQAPYFSPDEIGATARGVGALLGFPEFLTYLKHVRTNAFQDAPVRASRDRLPVVFYSHGYTSYLGQNTVLMEHLASHGYVVFSIQHAYDSAPTVFSDGQVVPMSPALLAPQEGPPSRAQQEGLFGTTLDMRLEGTLTYANEALENRNRIAAESAPAWLADRLFVHDALEQGAVPEEIAAIAAASNLARVGEMGMSFGGSTTGAVCMVDRRCAAGINLDGGDWHFLPLDASMPVPFLMFHSDIGLLAREGPDDLTGHPRPFNAFSYERIAEAGARPDVIRTTLRGSRHLGLSDSSLFIRRPLRDPLFGSTPAEVLIGAQNDFVKGFFDRYLLGQETGFPEDQLAAYDDWVSRIDVSEVSVWWRSLPEARRADYAARIDDLQTRLIPSAPALN